MDNNTGQCFRAIANEMLAVRLIATKFDEWPVLMHLSSKRHLLQMTKELQAAAVNDFLGLAQCRLGRKIDIQSTSKMVTVMFYRIEQR